MSKDRENKNDKPLHLKDVADVKLKLDKFTHKKEFTFLCELCPNKEKKRLEILDEDKMEKKAGLVYLFVFNGGILKVGSSTTDFKSRVSSYNCGKEKARDKGTCSTTNYFLLQSFLNINKKIEVHAFFATRVPNVDVFGTKIDTFYMPKLWEKVILEELKEKNLSPVFCTQT